MSQYIAILIKNIVFLPLWIISTIFPKSPNIWVFGAWEGSKYSDNSRYLFEYVLLHHPEIKSFWVASTNDCYEILKKNKLPVLKKYSFKGVFFSLRANLVICSNGLDDVNEFCSSGSKKIMLWHGIPMKKIEYDHLEIIDNGLRSNIRRFFSKAIYKNRFLFPFLYPDWDMVISTSSLTQDRMSSAFKIAKDNVPILGYPRNDVLLSSEHTLIKDLIPSHAKNTKYILYAPTFRSNTSDNEMLFKDLPYDKVNEFLTNKNACLFIKLHPALKNYESLLSLTKSENIIVLDNDVYQDINSILPNFDILLTDYSGVFYDYLLLDKPIIFTPFDLKKYTYGRGFYENYSDNMPGPICMNWSDTIKELYAFCNDIDDYSEQRNLCKLRYHDYYDTKSSLRVVNHLTRNYG
ncbi:CDP-glycerol glycerophosphotransferase family protein [Gammaproteobacteria bacterium]|nr:CDP-glycerol glycerophosphotransferase family protein [Gammaproteobacteria bacterium]